MANKRSRGAKPKYALPKIIVKRIKTKAAAFTILPGFGKRTSEAINAPITTVANKIYTRSTSK